MNSIKRHFSQPLPLPSAERELWPSGSSRQGQDSGPQGSGGPQGASPPSALPHQVYTGHSLTAILLVFSIPNAGIPLLFPLQNLQRLQSDEVLSDLCEILLTSAR